VKEMNMKIQAREHEEKIIDKEVGIAGHNRDDITIKWT